MEARVSGTRKETRDGTQEVAEGAVMRVITTTPPLHTSQGSLVSYSDPLVSHTKRR